MQPTRCEFAFISSHREIQDGSLQRDRHQDNPSSWCPGYETGNDKGTEETISWGHYGLLTIEERRGEESVIFSDIVFKILLSRGPHTPSVRKTNTGRRECGWGRSRGAGSGAGRPGRTFCLKAQATAPGFLFNFPALCVHQQTFISLLSFIDWKISIPNK